MFEEYIDWISSSNINLKYYLFLPWVYINSFFDYSLYTAQIQKNDIYF